MNKRKIILTSAVFLAGCQFWPTQLVAPAAPPYPTTGVPPVVVGPPYLQAPPMIQSGAQPGAVYPSQSTVVPLPSQTPGTIFATPPRPPMAGAPVTGVPPGAQVPLQPGPAGMPAVVAGPPNPIMVPVTDEN